MPDHLSKRRGKLAIAAVAAAALTLLSAGGIADADLQARIDAAKEDAQALEGKIQARGESIAALEADAEAARERIEELTGQLAAGEQRSAELSGELGTVEVELDATRARLERAQAVLADRLVEIYKSGDTSYIELILSSDGFDDISTRTEYLHAIADSDERAAARVRGLSDLVEAEVERISSLKAEIDDHNRELVASRDEVGDTRAELEQQTAELASARSEEQSDLADMREKIQTLVAQTSKGQVSEWFGEWAIPAYIVMCESGGNYHALNSSSGAGGAYQILPSTWKAYGGQGLPHQAPKAEQDRIASAIWQRSGPSQWSCA